MNQMEFPLDQRLAQQIEFIVEIDRAKQVLRRTLLTDKSRRENDAEHSWHIAVMALVLAEHAAEEIDLLRTIKMLLIHDIVEIDAGDTFTYDEAAQKDKAEREKAAAQRIFSLLPEDQAAEMMALWEEFEAKETPEARFAAALDRLQPLIHNYLTDGATWQEHGVSQEAVLARNRHMETGAPTLWAFARAMIEDAVARGILRP
mgnify:CR=1 FL=1